MFFHKTSEKPSPSWHLFPLWAAYPGWYFPIIETGMVTSWWRMIMMLAICQGLLNNHTWSPLSIYGAVSDAVRGNISPPSAQSWRPFGNLLAMIMLVMISSDISLEEMSRSKIKCQSRNITSTTASYKTQTSGFGAQILWICWNKSH